MLDQRRPLAATVAISLVLLPLWGGQAALAQVRDVFEVKGVAVDVTADTAAAAAVSVWMAAAGDWTEGEAGSDS